jgi:hypothetical protein
MLLKCVEYKEFPGTPDEWSLEGFMPKKINLIIGKNASGKTRTLNLIGGMGQVISGQRPLFRGPSEIKLEFNHHSKLKYLIAVKDGKVIAEKLIKNDETLLDRGIGGKGKIFAEQLDRFIDFQAPENVLACTVRRDAVQHPYFEEIFQWGDLIRHYHFGSQLGKDMLLLAAAERTVPVNFKDENNIVSIFKAAFEQFPGFTEIIVNDMKQIGYDIEIAVYAPLPLPFVPMSPLPGIPLGDLLGISVKEADLNKYISQIDMSQGMFRALALLIHVNLNLLQNTPCCFLIDDIGEGLDFDRSSALIKLLMDKVSKSPAAVQLMMTTNDRFTMNSVPLKYWSVIHRHGGKCKVFNYENSKKIFEDFAYTGLSNFDFFSTEFYEKGLEEE